MAMSGAQKQRAFRERRAQQQVALNLRAHLVANIPKVIRFAAERGEEFALSVTGGTDEDVLKRLEQEWYKRAIQCEVKQMYEVKECSETQPEKKSARRSRGSSNKA